MTLHPFSYVRAVDLQSALVAVQAEPGAAFIAGGTELIPLHKAGLASLTRVVDIGRLPLATVAIDDGTLSIGALARLSDVAANADVRREAPAVAQALLASASPQVRHMATVGGNLLQRTRCSYFRNGLALCNKRQSASGCGAIDGENRLHAVFGASAHCVATHASDLAVALIAADAQLRLIGPRGERRLALQRLYRLPGDRPECETNLEPGELITHVELRLAPCMRQSSYLKLRDRESFEFAVVSVAAGLSIADGIVRAACIAAGGVGTVPWRLPACEEALLGARCDDESLQRAAELASVGAAPLRHNAFKVDLLPRAVLRALLQTRDRS
ncbi:xanthine dehydrogenase family protein subunit M [Pelomonas sp. Root1237]|uniref:FAD binding domain-containing protein n=1 Tax=Pelomonas sp. Root1237 TaxID=1736434 RepID=UPI000A554477